MRRFLLTLMIVLAAALAIVPATQAQEEPQPVVRAVMFWMDTCGHCHYVLEDVLPPLQAEYGEQLDIMLIEIESAADADRMMAVARELGLNVNGVGVPFMVIGDHVLIGADQIPAELPELIETYLAEGGVAFPKLAALEGVLPATGLEPAPPELAEAEAEAAVPAAAAENAETAVGLERFEGALIAVAVLLGMTLALTLALGALWLVRAGRVSPPSVPWLAAVVPGLAALGLLVAVYLAYVETQAAAAVCGPVGDCNAVQSSEYARLFGVPIGIIGVAGYVAILLAWAWGQWSGRALPNVLLVLMTAAGVVFSIYLTWLELAVIHAVCMWCISSAVIMTLLLLASAGLLASGLAGQKQALLEA